MFSMTITKKHILSKLLVGLSLTLLMWGKAEATTFKFKKIVDTNTAIPNGSGNFTELLNANASLNHSVVTFETGGSNQPQGIYTYIDGSLTVVVDTNTPIPETTTNFKYFNSYLLDNGQVVFLGAADVNDASHAVYINRDGSLKVVAHVNTFLPNGIGNSNVLEGVSLSKREIVFREHDYKGTFGFICRPAAY